MCQKKLLSWRHPIDRAIKEGWENTLSVGWECDIFLLLFLGDEICPVEEVGDSKDYRGDHLPSLRLYFQSHFEEHTKSHFEGYFQWHFDGHFERHFQWRFDGHIKSHFDGHFQWHFDGHFQSLPGRLLPASWLLTAAAGIQKTWGRTQLLVKKKLSVEELQKHMVYIHYHTNPKKVILSKKGFPLSWYNFSCPTSVYLPKQVYFSSDIA